MLSKYKLFYERNLPHFQPAGATLFITFRLKESLPKIVIKTLIIDQQNKELEISKIANLQAREKAVYLYQKEIFNKFDKELDNTCQGPRWLADPRIAEMVCRSLHYLDGRKYSLEAYCLMPNHVHLVCNPLNNEDGVIPMSDIMKSLKGYTARQANQILGHKGAFWQHESYDHVVRDNSEFIRIVNYVLDNPARSGLPARWVYCK
jgi:putative transposase